MEHLIKHKNAFWVFIPYVLLALFILFKPVLSAEIPLPNAWADQGIVLENGSNGAWDAKEYLQMGSVVKKNGTYFLYYCGSSGDRRDGGAAYRAAGVATSSDGINFTKYSGNPIVTFIPQPNHVNAEEEGAEVPVVILDDNGDFLMYYCASTATGTWSVDADIRIATSTDGLNFTDQGIVLGETSEAWATGVLHANGGTQALKGTWHVWFTSDRAGFSGYKGGLLTGDAPDNLTIQPSSPIFSNNAPISWVWPILHSNGVVTLFESSGAWGVNEIKVRETTIDNLDTYSAPVMTFRAADNPMTEHYGSYGGHIVFHDVDAKLWRMYYVATLNGDICIRLRTAPLATTRIKKGAIENPDNLKVNPNPFYFATNFELSFNEGQKTVLQLFNIKGELITTLLNENIYSGNRKIMWNAKNLTSQMIVARLTIDNTVSSQILMLIK